MRVLLPLTNAWQVSLHDRRSVGVAQSEERGERREERVELGIGEKRWS
jgi:hypothetical protein